MKLILCGINSKYIHSNLAIRYLKAFTEDIDYNCVLKEYTINNRIEQILEDIILEKPDVIGFSTYIWNLEYVQKISNIIKAINKNIIIFYGGPEVSFNGNEFLSNSPGDFLIEGEGEETYKEFVNELINTKNFKKIKGLFTKENEEIFYGGKRSLMEINRVKFPYGIDENLDNKIVYYEASRGCPFNCKYCLSSTIHGVRFLDINRVKEELSFFIKKGVTLIKFVDRTFNCNHEFAYEIWKHLIEIEGETSFHFEISADLLTSDEIELLKRAPKDKFQFEVGVQTTNSVILKNINRFVNFNTIKDKVEELLKLDNIKQHLDLIAGLPGENYESFRNSFNDVYKIHPEEIQLGFLKLLKGSSMRSEADLWGMIASPYPPYEILKTKDLSFNELIKLKRVEAMVDKYYNSQKFNSIIKFFENKYKEPFEFYFELGEFFKKKGYFERNIASSEYYKVFIDFNEEIRKDDNMILSEIIKFDYLTFNKKKYLPNFLERYSYNKNVLLRKQGHIERFKINVIKFISENKVEFGDYYYYFHEDNKVPKDITVEFS